MTGPPTVWVATTHALRQRSLAARIRVLGDLEDYAGKTPGEPLDQYDGPAADLFGADYGGETVGVGRVLCAPDFQSAAILVHAGVALPRDLTRWAEPTRTGILPELRGTPVGKDIARRLVGLEIRQSLARGRTHWLVTMRLPMLRLLQFLPWQLGPPVAYSPASGGPAVNEPIWTATLDLRLAAVATWMLRPDLYATLYPGRPPSPEAQAAWLESGLEASTRANLPQATQFLERWQAGREHLMPLPDVP